MTMLSEKGKVQLKQKGISENQLNAQLKRFQDGFPFLKIEAAATVDKGIMRLTSEDQKHYENIWSHYIKGNRIITKFVPASGAASRMFKDLFSFLDAPYTEPKTEFEKEFFEKIETFAFYDTLNQACAKTTGKTIEQLLAEKSFKPIVHALLMPEGLNYGNLPKGLLEFHKYEDTSRTPVEEHLVEGSLYAANASKTVNLHFTVSPEHRELFISLVDRKKKLYEQKYEVQYNIAFSEQKPSTDTIAVNMDNSLFDDNGSLLFRPGGHGALIENLNDIESDIVFVKNIDNTIPDKRKSIETRYKKTLAGVLVDKQSKAFDYIELLESGSYTHDQLLEMLYFLQRDLNIKKPDTKYLEDVELALYIKSKLDRPMRVCGMVRNEGEPGGGPFLAKNADGTTSLQIVESSQIDMTNNESLAIVKVSSHFNPVDLVCAISNREGRKYKLLSFVDADTGFISEKSKDGVPLKALELPGLWNGAMSNWNTVFVEVPTETFNPVKTVNDLLRTNHL